MIRRAIVVWVVVFVGAATEAGADEAASAACSDAKQAARTLADVRANIRANPGVAMQQLGLTVDEFEYVARALYRQWQKLHPERPAVAAAAPPRATQVVTSEDESRWWCFKRADQTVGDCRETRVECNEVRTRFLDPTGPARDRSQACDPLLTKQECEDISNSVRVDMAARIHRVTQCEHQERVACFRVRNVLSGVEGSLCGPTIKMCKERRTATRAHQSDDVKILSDCRIEGTK